ncbi:MAG: hypothetical protein LBU84_02785 [Prevotella sp.]|jgi:hypothetical protein|nr:hypothetical protein [Prevotella sp.]
MNKYLLILLLIISGNISAQMECVLYGDSTYIAPFAIINDADGYTNVRDAENNIIGQVKENDIFAVPSYGEYSYPYDYIIWATKTTQGRYDFDESGLMHHSRIKYLSQMPMLKRTIKDNTVTFSNKKCQVVIKTGPFEKDKHDITPEKDRMDGPVTVDGYEVYGIDGIFYNDLKGIKSISYKIEGKEYKMPQEYLMGYFSPNPDNMFVAVGDDGSLFISMTNGDAAGGYGVAWKIKDENVSVVAFRDF